MIYDPAALDLLAHQVLNCVCAELTRVAELQVDLEQPGCPCRAYVAAGTVPADTCCGDCGEEAGGQLTVAVTGLFPTQRFPVEDRTTTDPCGPTKLAAQFTVTLYRCYPGPDNRGNPPTVEQLQRSSRVLHTDMLTVHHAVTCCANRDANGKKRQIALQSHRTLGPAGGCVGNELVFALDTGINCCPEELS